MSLPAPEYTTIRAVFFDFDGTLRHNDPSAHHFFFDHAVSLGAVDSPQNRRAASRWAHLYWNGKGEVVMDTESLGYNSPAFWLNFGRKYLLSFNCPPGQAEELAPHITRHMSENYRPSNLLDPDAPELLEKLQAGGFTLGVVSNRDQPYHETLEELGIAGLFDVVLAAGEVESWKPHPEIFHHALERAGAAPGETLYVGDNYFADVVGARTAGLQPVLYDPEAIFPEADCPVIDRLGGLQPLLKTIA